MFKKLKRRSKAVRVVVRCSPKTIERLDDVETLVRTNRHDLDLQFGRMAQLQAEVDELRAKVRKLLG